MTDLTKLIELQNAALESQKESWEFLYQALNFDFAALDAKIKRMEKIIEDLKNEIMYEHLPVGSVTTFLGKDVGYWYGMDAKIKRYEDALKSIAANSCCDSCQEAKLMARKALEGME